MRLPSRVIIAAGAALAIFSANSVFAQTEPAPNPFGNTPQATAPAPNTSTPKRKRAKRCSSSRKARRARLSSTPSISASAACISRDGRLAEGEALPAIVAGRKIGGQAAASPGSPICAPGAAGWDHVAVRLEEVVQHVQKIQDVLPVALKKLSQR